MTESIQILVEKDRLQPLADNIKVLRGSDSITLRQMEDTIEETNIDLVSQTDLIAQLASALQGKSVPGGEDVTAETVTYTDLLTDLEAAVNALPDAGSGGATIKTCTVTFSHTLGQLAGAGSNITYTSYVDGIFGVSTTYLSPIYTSRVLENVVCGSAITVTISYNGPLSYAITGGTSVTTIYHNANTRIWQATNEAGASDIISIGLASS